MDKMDRDFVFLILARDEVNHYRAFEVETSVPSISEAREKLIARMKMVNTATSYESGPKWNNEGSEPIY
ncbi:MAG: hypothetical protein IPJ20_16905 [Flammeovirgaceae bacterium]|nr:hypothetical protein [Flammeovirgaceae bacterium]